MSHQPLVTADARDRSRRKAIVTALKLVLLAGCFFALIIIKQAWQGH